jgi:hypothetical protein
VNDAGVVGARFRVGGREEGEGGERDHGEEGGAHDVEELEGKGRGKRKTEAMRGVEEK